MEKLESNPCLFFDSSKRKEKNCETTPDESFPDSNNTDPRERFLGSDANYDSIIIMEKMYYHSPTAFHVNPYKKKQSEYSNSDSYDRKKMAKRKLPASHLHLSANELGSITDDKNPLLDFHESKTKKVAPENPNCYNAKTHCHHYPVHNCDNAIEKHEHAHDGSHPVEYYIAYDTNRKEREEKKGWILFFGHPGYGNNKKALRSGKK